MDIEAIKNKVKAGKYIISFTHTEKLRVRKIESHHIEESISNGIIIETYPADPRGLSCLILGHTLEERPLHVVCGNIEEEEILIITAYEPDPLEWKEDWKTRRK
ncbi:MAG: DUF4258 domain-containing protein [Nitrospinae bacterium]|nr:DUF4258 domain-containing protein [Nitrospinota bacterium]